VNYFGKSSWYNYVPIVNIFAPYIENTVEEFDYTTYFFTEGSYSLTSEEVITGTPIRGQFMVHLY